MTAASWADTHFVGGRGPTKLIDYPVDLASGGSTNLITRSVDSTTFETSTLKVTPSGAGAYISLANGTLDWTDYDALMLEFYVDTIATNTGMTIYCVENSGWTVDKNFTFTVNTQGFARGRHLIKIRHDQTTSIPGPYVGAFPYNSVAGWADAGSPSGAQAVNLVNFRIQFNNAHQGPYPIYLKALWGAARVRPKVILYFDNWQGGTVGANYDAAHTAIRPTIGSGGYGWKWGVTIPLDEIGSSSNGPVSVLQTLESEGCDVCCNDTTDRNMVTQVTTAADANAAISLTRNTLRSYGLNRGLNTWVWNNNATNALLMDAARANGIVLGRMGLAERPLFQRQNGVPTSDELLRVGAVVLQDMTSTQMIAHVNRAITYGGDLHCYWHTFAPTGTSSQRPSVVNAGLYGNGLTTYTSAFLAFAAELRRLEMQGLVDVVSPSDWYLGLTQPALVA